MIFFSIASLILVLFFAYLLFKNEQFDRIKIIALILKCAAGIFLGLIYKFHYEGGDTFQYFNEAGKIASFLMHNPNKFLDIFFSTNLTEGLSEKVIFSEQPRALFFTKIISIFYLMTGGNYWIISIILSFISFLGINLLVNELIARFSNLGTEVNISFYFLPSFVFWTSGLLKESLTFSALAVAVTIALKFYRTDTYHGILDWFLLILSLTLLWMLKYYYASVVIPLLSLLLIYGYMSRRKKYRLIFSAIALVLASLLIVNLHYNLNLSRVLSIVYENYNLSLALSEGSAIQYYRFDGSIAGFLLNIPLALLSGLFRPVVFESENIFQFIVAVENLTVVCLLIFGLWYFGLKTKTWNIYIIIGLMYITFLATMIAFSTPNFGTLSRYKVAYWPFFVLLIFSLFSEHKKRSDFKT